MSVGKHSLKPPTRPTPPSELAHSLRPGGLRRIGLSGFREAPPVRVVEEPLNGHPFGSAGVDG